MKQFLAEVLPYWNQLTPKQQEKLAEAAVSKKFAKGEIIFNPLKQFAGLKIVRIGQMKIYLSSGNGDEIMLYRLKKGDVCVLSVLSLMKKFTFAVTARAEKETEIITIPEAAYMEVSRINRSADAYNQTTLIERISEALSIMSRAAWGTTEQRLAELLLNYDRDAGGRKIRVTHEILADDIGTAREVISRTLKQFQEQKLIETERGKIQVTDRQGLREIIDRK